MSAPRWMPSPADMERAAADLDAERAELRSRVAPLEHVEPTPPSRLPTPEERAAAVRPASLGRASATAERVAARDAVQDDRAAILARLDAIDAAATDGPARAFAMLDALRAELRGAS